MSGSFLAEKPRPVGGELYMLHGLMPSLLQARDQRRNENGKMKRKKLDNELHFD
jgi:hypothetical protein